MIQINTEFDRKAYLNNSLKNSDYTAHFLKEEVPTLEPAATLEISEEGLEKIQSGEYRKEYDRIIKDHEGGDRRVNYADTCALRIMKGLGITIRYSK